MTLTIDLTPTEEAHLVAFARQQGVDPEQVVHRLVTEHVPPVSDSNEQDPTLALFAQWDKEDANITPEEVAKEDRSWQEFKSSINAERDGAGARRVF